MIPEALEVSSRKGKTPPNHSSRAVWTIGYRGVFASIGVGIGLLFFVLAQGCGGPILCSNHYASSTHDPQGLACSLHCDCNNQTYTGRCIDGICQSLPRETCPVAGMSRPCDRPWNAPLSCDQGRQICRPAGLSATRWGDCLFHPTPEDTREACKDGKDNDCNGKIDADDPGCSVFCNPGQIRPCFDGDPTQKNQGLCKEGQEICLPLGRWDACRGSILPTFEVCDSQDNDCDGQVDEGDACACPTPGQTQACYSGPPPTAGQGLCRPGLRTCLPSGSWGECSGQILPAEEVCNGKDDDCDGAVDNGLRVCLCTPGHTRPCSPSEPYPLQGLCRIGSQTCLPSGSWGECSGFVTPATEICDGLDNDCDGLIDNLPPTPENQRNPCQCWPPGRNEPCYDAEPTFLNRGTCKAGLRICQASGRWSLCQGQTTPSAEICDGLDNDCDGFIDNQLPGSPAPLSQACFSDTRGCLRLPDGSFQCSGPCTTGRHECQQGRWPLFCPREITPTTEVCDGLDNDCDGLIDNQPGDTAFLTRPCYDHPEARDGCLLLDPKRPDRFTCKGICQTGLSRCDGKGRWESCRGLILPTSEICSNQKDDDCDGKTDEGC